MEGDYVPATHIFHKRTEEAFPRVLQVCIDDTGVDAVCRDTLFVIAVLQGTRVDDIGQFRVTVSFPSECSVSEKRDVLQGYDRAAS